MTTLEVSWEPPHILSILPGQNTLDRGNRRPVPIAQSDAVLGGRHELRQKVMEQFVSKPAPLEEVRVAGWHALKHIDHLADMIARVDICIDETSVLLPSRPRC